MYLISSEVRIRVSPGGYMSIVGEAKKLHMHIHTFRWCFRSDTQPFIDECLYGSVLKVMEKLHVRIA